MNDNVNQDYELNNFESLQIGLASPEKILELVSWRGHQAGDHQLQNAQARKGRTCTASGSSDRRKDWECHCGKYKRIRYKGIVCDTLRRRGHQGEGQKRADGAHQAGRPGLSHLVL